MDAPDRDRRLHDLIDQAVRAIPPRSAPASLERRVLAELERRAAAPWWRKDFLQWPVAARLFFLIASAGLIRLVVGAPGWMRQSSLVEMPPELSWIQTTAEAISLAAHHLPSLLVYCGAALVVSLYVTFFGLSAIAWRAASAHRL
jgi:hypothetical protein